MTTEEQTADEQNTETDAPRNALAGAVDWGLAARTGARLTPSGPKMSRYTADQVVAELIDAAVRAEGPVREVTGLADGLPVPGAEVVDRPGWVRAAARSMAELSGSGTADGGSRFTGKPAGVQAGAMLAFLSTAILGQYDPFAAPAEDAGGGAGSLILVAPNIVAVERALGVEPSDFRLWVCLHEVTHRVQFSSSPWLAEHMQRAVGVLGDVGEESVSDLVGRIGEALRERRNGTDDSQPGRGERSDGGYSGIVGLLRATQAPPQREALDQLLVLGTLLEGHADHVMDAVGPVVVPTVEKIRAAFDERRVRSKSPLQRLIRALLGMDAKMQQYVRGKAFVDAVVERVGMAEFNTVWTGPDTLPLPAEIEAPEKWIARVLS